MPLDANHYELNKFEKEDDPRYTEVRSKILEMVEEKLGKNTYLLNSNEISLLMVNEYQEQAGKS